MELTACIEGVKAAMSIGANNIILETDAQEVVWALQGDDFRLSVVGGLVHELKDLVIGNFSSFIIKHAPRDCNRVAHELALIGSRSNNLVPSVLAGVPSCITVLVSGDLADMVE
jgi:ribonuclease HI